MNKSLKSKSKDKDLDLKFKLKSKDEEKDWKSRTSNWSCITTSELLVTQYHNITGKCHSVGNEWLHDMLRYHELTPISSCFGDR